MSFSSIYKHIQRHTPKFIYINKYYRKKAFKILDIGSGNGSATKIKKLFPLCAYHGVDIDKTYNNSAADMAAMDFFYEMDLTKLNFTAIPDNTFDYIRIAHVIEHLHNGDEVVQHLIPKMKPGGHIYIEYPAEKSTKLPSMQGTLNFYDDPTHVRIYSLKEMKAVVTKGGCRVIASGSRRNVLFIAAMPFRIINHLLRGKKLQGNFFWDVLGFAAFVFAQKSVHP